MHNPSFEPDTTNWDNCDCKGQPVVVDGQVSTCPNHCHQGKVPPITFRTETPWTLGPNGYLIPPNKNAK
jgi:hypothetical protein